MPTFESACVLVLLIAASACDRSTSATGPTSSPPGTQPVTGFYSGQVTDAITSAPIAGATVSASCGGYNCVPLSATTDSSGKYSFSAQQRNAIVWDVSANGYDPDYQWVQPVSVSQAFHLYLIERITAGASAVVTVAPTDSLCDNNVQDPTDVGPVSVCRTVHVTAPTAGTLTVGAPTESQTGLEVEIPLGRAWLQNPVSIPVTAGTDVVVNVEMAAGSTTSQSFTVNTSIGP